MSIRPLKNVKNPLVHYQNNFEHLRDELQKLDVLIQRRTLVFRQTATFPSQTDLAHAYISHEEVDHLLKPQRSFEGADPESDTIQKSAARIQKETQEKVMQSAQAGVFLALPHLAHIFSLSPFEVATLVICLAPELERKYDKLYAYLQDDITRKKPSVDLVLDLLCATEAERWHAHSYFSGQAPLFRAGLLQIVEDVQSPSGSSDLARFIKIDPRILNYLLGANSVDAALSDLCTLTFPQSAPDPFVDPLFIDPSIQKNLMHFMQSHFADQKKDRKKLTFHFYGPYGVGKKALVLDLCRSLNIPVLTLDVKRLMKDDVEGEAQLRRVFREGLLQQAALFFEGIDPFLSADSKGEGLLSSLQQAMRQYGWLTFMSGEKAWTHPALFQALVFQSIPIPMPDAPLRKAAWVYHLSLLKTENPETWAEVLSAQFRLSPGQIRDAVGDAKIQQAMKGSDTLGTGSNNQSKITCADLFMACRKQSNQKLQEMAHKIKPGAGWEDLILPEAQLAQLQEICNQVEHRAQVFGEWGFDQKLSYGKGLSVLFSGPSGTGKTLAAEVIAHALGLDCYKIDLSGLVSKYIGETEKNLSKVFQEAETSNAILFFDEADALFGKRTEVSDAHDRYANIETSYLLQKMEEYDGIVILTTNLRDNMDEAFTRRIRFIVEFPFPETEHRLAIWKRHFPKKAPISEDIDLDFLSKKVQVSGGNIKNIVLNAAFLAAENGQIIGMDHLIQGTKREYEKIGKLWDEHRLDPTKEKVR